VFIGHKYFLNNLAAIVRLRHNMLKRFEFAESDIVYEESWSEHEAIIDVNNSSNYMNNWLNTDNF
jgi:choline kinase